MGNREATIIAIPEEVYWCDELTGEENLSYAYFEASEQVRQAICSMDDTEVTDRHIEQKLYAALYHITYFLLKRKGREAPKNILSRVYRVKDAYGKTYIPLKCLSILEPHRRLYRDELSEIGQAMDVWIALVYKLYSNEICLSVSSHSFVGGLA